MFGIFKQLIRIDDDKTESKLPVNQQGARQLNTFIKFDLQNEFSVSI